MRNSLRPIVTCIWWLTIGAAITVAIALALSLWLDKESTTSRSLYRIPDLDRTWMKSKLLGYTRVEFALAPNGKTPIPPATLDIIYQYWLDGTPADSETDDERLNKLEVLDPPQWTSYAFQYIDAPETKNIPFVSHEIFGFDEAFGWPFLSFRCIWMMDVGTDEYKIRGGLRLADTLQLANPGQVRGIPLIPIWIGLLADSVVFGFIIFLANSGMKRWRRSRRQRKGLCLQCGYDQRGDNTVGCPECGWGRDGVKA